MDGINVHPLCVGLTRPPMRFGVTLPLLVLTGACGLALFVATLSFGLALAVSGALHAVSVGLCAIDPDMLTIVRGKLQCMNGKNSSYWGCNSYEPY